MQRDSKPEAPRLLSSTLLHETPRLKFYNDIYLLPDGTEHDRQIIRHPGAVVIVPRFPDGTFTLIRQYRFPVGSELLEFPAGTLEGDASPADCAAREVREEIGYTAGKVTPLGSFYTAPGFCDEILHAFLAEDLIESATDFDDGEMISGSVRMTKDEVLAAIRTGELRDAKSIAALQLLTLHGL